MLERVISGGQRGADRGGLDGAIRFFGNTDRIGGWCPSSRRAEDGPIPSKYPLQETSEWTYPPRTELNVKEADGTVVFTAGSPSGGSKLTVKLAEKHCKPVLHVDVATTFWEDAVEVLIDWIDGYRIETINVAGSRESTTPGIQETVDLIIHDVLAAYHEAP